MCTFKEIAITQTNISEYSILIFVSNLSGKSIKNHASATGVHNTKKDHVKTETKIQSFNQ